MSKLIKYQIVSWKRPDFQVKSEVEITTFVEEKNQHIKISFSSSSAEELLKDVKKILDKSQKTWIEKILGIVK